MPAPGQPAGFYCALDDYLTYCKIERNLSPKTVSAYSVDLIHFGKSLPALVLADIRRLEHADVIKYFTTLKKKYKVRSINRIQSALKSFLGYLERHLRVSFGFLDQLVFAKQPPPFPDFLSTREVDGVISVFSQDSNISPAKKRDYARNRMILRLLYGTGMRVSELVALEKGDVTEEGFLRVTGKGEKTRVVPVLEKLLEELHNYNNMVRVIYNGHLSCPALFLNSRGGRLSRVSVWKITCTAARQAGIKRAIYPHTFRHSFATHLLRGGADIRSVQELLGHADIRTTEIYTHLDTAVLTNMIRTCHPLYLPKRGDNAYVRSLKSS